MRIGILCSGGDGSGVNACLYQLYKKLKKHEVVLFNHGLEGVINNEVSNVTFKDIKNAKNDGGIIIKTSRSERFLTTRGFNKFKENLEKNRIDLLIILGGNGSLLACKKIVQAGIKCAFIPLTIDNDLLESDYSIGFDTAVSNATYFIENINKTMETFDRICIYEVMGRNCPEIAIGVANNIKDSFLFKSGSKFEDCLDFVKKRLKVTTSPIIVLQENVINGKELEEYLIQNIKNCKIKFVQVGYFQRGGKPTEKDRKSVV